MNQGGTADNDYSSLTEVFLSGTFYLPFDEQHLLDEKVPEGRMSCKRGGIT